ncbi:MAG: pilus assembly protein, partial [Janthinobacterium lividum]
RAGSVPAPNGLATTAPVDVDGDNYIDYVYAGDLLGNMWKFDLTDAAPASWAPAFGTVAAPLPFYTAKDSSGTVQKITSAPDALINPAGGIVLNFGTGSYVTTADKTNTSKGTVYGLRDVGVAIDSTSRANLQAQVISVGTASDGVSVTSYRTVTANTVAAGKKGWYMDLPDGGERVVNDPRVIGSVLAFTTTVPNSDVCGFGGTSWDYYVDALTGSNLNYSVFTGLGSLTYKNTSNVTTATGFASAIKSNVGMTSNGSLITSGKSAGIVIHSGTTGQSENYDIFIPGSLAGRVSWREIITD